MHNKTFHYIRDFLPGFWLVGSIIADVLICATLVRILWQSQTGFKDTDGVVLRLIRLSVESAAVPVIAASIKLALIYSYEDKSFRGTYTNGANVSWNITRDVTANPFQPHFFNQAILVFNRMGMNAHHAKQTKRPSQRHKTRCITCG